MRSHRITGMPQKCLNRTCGAYFTKASHLGYLMKSEIEVFAVMRCPDCRDTFVISQATAMAHEYYKKLPKNSASGTNKTPITIEEMRNFSKKLSDPANLDTILESDANIDDGLGP